MPSAFTGPLARRQRRQRAIPGSWPTFNPSPGLWIEGIDFSAYVVAWSPNIKTTVSPYAGVFSCRVDGPISVMSTIKVEQELTWNADGVLYAGRIRSILPEDEIIASAGIILTIECQDFTTLLDRDICAFAVSPRTPYGNSVFAPDNPNRTIVESDAQRINWLLLSFGRQGVTNHHVQQNYATVPATDYTGMTLKAAIQSVLAYSGASFYVDYAKDLHCFLTETQYAPFSLSETPDDVTSSAYTGLNFPSDSVDLRNAIYGIPGTPAPLLQDIISEIITTTGGPVTGTGSMDVLIYKRLANMPEIAEVARGPLTIGSNTAVAPTFQNATKVGDTAFAFVTATTGDPVCSDSSWVADQPASGPDYAKIFRKSNLGAGEAAPTFTSAGGTAPMHAQLVEFNASVGGLINGATGGLGSTTTSTINLGLDQDRGSLIVWAARWAITSAATATFSQSFPNGAVPTNTANTGNSASTKHSSFNYGVVPGALPTWYHDQASIALYGRHESSFSDTTVMTQSDLDALGAAALMNNAWPRQEGKFKCRRAGLAVGQRFTIASSIYAIPVIADPLGNYSGIVQAVTISYSEDEPGPIFEVEFLRPTLNLAVQLANVIASIPDSVATPTVGTLQSADLQTAQAGISAETDVNQLSITIRVLPNRRTRLSAFAQVVGTVSTDNFTLFIVDAISGLKVVGATSAVVAAAAGGSPRAHFSPWVVLRLAAGDYTFKVTFARNNGTGTGTINAAATQPASILAEDIGPA